MKYLSELLDVEGVYTRAEISTLLKSKDLTINTGVFKPTGWHSIILFVTSKKQKDLTQYTDFFQDDILIWQGQMSGKSDTLIMRHQEQLLELLVMYRDSKFEYPQFGFKFMGCYKYLSHREGKPSTFTLAPL